MIIWPGLADLGTFAVFVIGLSVPNLSSLARLTLRVLSPRRTH
jgi:hypothetical protein